MSYRVAIPSNRVNVSYLWEMLNYGGRISIHEVAIPSNRVNVSYKNHNSSYYDNGEYKGSQSPQIGSMFPTGLNTAKRR